MKSLIPILTITGSDSNGASGIQADIKTISLLGGYACTAITSISVRSSNSDISINDLSTDLVIKQILPIFEEFRPKAIKIGLVRDVRTIIEISKEIVRCDNIVLDSAIKSSKGETLIPPKSVTAIKDFILPKTKVLIIKRVEAEHLLSCNITTTQEMENAARELLKLGPWSVLIQGGHCADGIVTDIFVTEQDSRNPHYFTSPDTDGWNLHGVGGTLSSAVATFLGKGESVRDAVIKAHEYIRNLVIYSVSQENSGVLQHVQNNKVSPRIADIYNQLMSLVAKHCKQARDVNFYADKLNITPRYLSQITHKIVSKSPKELIDNYLMKEIEEVLITTSLSMQEISYRYGFASPSLFCKYFRLNKGISPVQYRNINNKQ